MGQRVDVQVLAPREVPLGGPRAMSVRRTLPARERSLIGAWCFVDHYGPDDVARTGGMDVAPHPHCGLATVSWLFEGEIEHRDSLGTLARVRPGEVNLMTAGHGIAHSEVSTDATSVLHGVQLWLALPEGARERRPGFEHHVPEDVRPAEGVEVAVFLGSLAGSTSPVPTATPLLGAEVRLAPGATWELDVPSSFEVGVLLDTGSVTYAGCSLSVGDLAVVGGEAGAEVSGRHTGLVLTAGDDGARLVVLGGPPFGEEIVMWWNFIGRSHEEVVAARASWNANEARFGHVDGYVPRAEGSWWIPAPELPGVRLRPRGNR
jgi:redox-sensitive bicupin YhaK (pirin superfamily)